MRRPAPADLSQNTALFSLLGTTYGGDGKSTFALPDLQGRAPMHPGQGPGLSPHDLGETGGSDTVTLLESEMPAHTHPLQATPQPGEDPAPGPQEALARSTGANLYQSNTTQNLVPLAPSRRRAGRRRPAAQQPPALPVGHLLHRPPGGLPASFVTPSVELRPAAATDQEFRFHVYACSRAEELAVVDWDGPARRAFLRQQFDARETWYRDQFAGATVDIVTVDGERAGVLCVDRGAEIRIVEIALVPERRGRGAGTALLRAVLAEADAAGKRVTVHVEALNPARRLYDRLGFTVAEDKGVYVLLERLPT